MPEKFYIRNLSLFFLIFFNALIYILIYGSIFIESYYITAILFSLMGICSAYDVYKFLFLKKAILEIHEDKLISRSTYSFAKKIFYLKNIIRISIHKKSIVIVLDSHRRGVFFNENKFTRLFNKNSFLTEISLHNFKNKEMAKSAIANWASQKEGVLIGDALV